MDDLTGLAHLVLHTPGDGLTSGPQSPLPEMITLHQESRRVPRLFRKTTQLFQPWPQKILTFQEKVTELMEKVCCPPHFQHKCTENHRRCRRLFVSRQWHEDFREQVQKVTRTKDKLGDLPAPSWGRLQTSRLPRTQRFTPWLAFLPRFKLATHLC